MIMKIIDNKNYDLDNDLFPQDVYCSKCRRSHAPPVCVPTQYDFANVIFAVVIMLGIFIYLPIVQKCCPTPIHFPPTGTPGGAWVDPTSTVIVTPTPDHAN